MLALRVASMSIWLPDAIKVDSVNVPMYVMYLRVFSVKLFASSSHYFFLNVSPYIKQQTRVGATGQLNC